ncbi:MAG: SMI1/KNR4 family protein [Deferribacteraceae bacterium]|jgi:hypothetical protein|nr:SMI1/KNR4 family protein [Deferribacteraceae bacterium]
MAIKYNVNSCEILELLVDDAHKESFTEAEIKDFEAEIGAQLPQSCRDFMKHEDDMHLLNMEGCCRFLSHNILQEDLKEMQEELADYEQEDEPDEYYEVYSKLNKLPVEQWGQVTDNYLLLWNENQGIWHAGVLLSDLQAGVENPAVYISTEEDFISFRKEFNSVEDFLQAVMIGDSIGYRSDELIRGQEQIKAALAKQGIDFAQLRVKHEYSSGRAFYMGNCILNQDTLYYYFENANDKKGRLIVAERGSRRTRH